MGYTLALDRRDGKERKKTASLAIPVCFGPPELIKPDIGLGGTTHLHCGNTFIDISEFRKGGFRKIDVFRPSSAACARVDDANEDTLLRTVAYFEDGEHSTA